MGRVGLIATLAAGSVLAVGLVLYLAFQYGRTLERGDMERQINEQQQQTRQRIDEAIRSVPRDTSPDDNRQWLLDRQRQRQ